MTNAIHPVDQKLPFLRTLIYGAQHVLAMYAGAVAVPLVLAGAIGLSTEQLIYLINADLFTCGIATLVQALSIRGVIGAKLPIVQGCTFTAVTPMIIIANDNPLRYRGYFYDTDLGFYLLESRYYDPETGRFINADGVLDNRVEGNKNLYAYCANDPINYCDENGRWLASMVAGAVIGAASGAITAWAKGGSKKDIKRAAFYGGISGAVSGLIGGVLGNIRTA